MKYWGSRIIVAGRFIDGSGAGVLRNVFLAVEKGIITAIDSTAHLPRNDKAVVDDFSHCTILPTLIDCCVSLSRSPSIDRDVRLSSEESGLHEKTAMLARHIHDCHAHGVLGVADSDDITYLLEHHQKGMTRGSRVDIRIPCRPRQNNHCAASNPAGGDFLKLSYSGNIEDENAPSPQLSYENLCRILQNRGEKKAMVTANGPQQVEEALAAGCDAIEQGYGMGENNLRKMADMGVLWIPSVLRARNSLDAAGSGGEAFCRFSLRYVAPGKQVPGAEAFWKKMVAEQLTLLRLARKLGVTTAVGTGAGSVGILHGESMAEEMKLFIKAGYSREETIQCASGNGAEFFGMDRLGTLTVGRRATFLITRGTVQQLPRKLSYLEGIYVDGTPSPAYRKNPVRTA